MTTMTTEDTRVSVPEAARRLGMRGSEVYGLIFDGQLDAEPTLTEGVRVSVASLERWLAERPDGPSAPAHGDTL